MSASSSAPAVAHPSALDALAKSFEPQAIEAKWYPRWEAAGAFVPHGDGKRPTFAIQLPPPNVTGTLHMGHAFQQTLMDTLMRYHRMLGDDANWVVGTDHAGIATQIVVERQLQAQGSSRHDIGREAFVRRVWDWKEHSGSTITRQMRRLGASANWSFADASGAQQGYFTMDEHMSKGVVETFVRLYEEGLICRGKRMVNWDPVLQSAVSDLEVESVERAGHLWHIRYPLSDGSGHVVVATTRPEMMLGDTAVMVHPEDERYRHLIGKTVTLPLTGRTLPIIADPYVDREFGTGVVKVTPAHDFNDYAVAQRHALPMLIVLTLAATIVDGAAADAAGIPADLRGLDRFVARERVVARLEAEGALVATKPHTLQVPMCERTGQIVEPMLTDNGSSPRARRRRSTRAASPVARSTPSEAATSASFPSTGRRPTTTGSRTSRTGASRANSGGGTRFPRGTTPMAASTSPAAKPKRSRRAAARRSGATPTCSIPGSPRRSSATRHWAGPTKHASRVTSAICRATCWSPATTSSSSGWRAWS